MSDNIPFEMQMEIMKRLPVISLIQFRSVSKPWKSLIDSPKFIADYHPRRHNHRLLLRYIDPHEDFHKYVILVDDDNFPQHKIPMTLPLSLSTSQGVVSRHVSISTSQGLVCFSFTTYGNRNDHIYITMIAVLWNPAIRKWVDIVMPDVLSNNRILTMDIGFGVSPHTNDPLLVKMTCVKSVNSDCVLWHVEVFTLSTGVWRSLCTNLPCKSIGFSTHVAIDSFIYWICFDRYDIDGGGWNRNMIMSFDMISELFKEISLPDCLTYFHSYMLEIFKLKESLVVLETDEYAEIQEYVVWIMEQCAPNSFRKLYTIKAPDASIEKVFGFRKSDEPIIDRFYFDGRYTTSYYDPCSQCFNDFVISDNACLNHVSSYTETLLLLDR